MSDESRRAQAREASTPEDRAAAERAEARARGALAGTPGVAPMKADAGYMLSVYRRWVLGGVQAGGNPARDLEALEDLIGHVSARLAVLAIMGADSEGNLDPELVERATSAVREALREGRAGRGPLA